MNNDADREGFLDAFRDDSPLWSVVKELATTSETKLRRILRPHTEARFNLEDDAQAVDQRRRLDAALGALTQLEIAYQVGVVNEPVQLPGLDHLKKLFESEAILRYVNSYLYFGVRFLAGRVAPPSWIANAVERQPPKRKSNERPFFLVAPPNLAPFPDISATFFLFRKLVSKADPSSPSSGSRATVDQVTALEFLDGFWDPKRVERFELWLRGLRPEADAEMSQFLRVSNGLVEWALARRDFYSSLETAPSTPDLTSESDSPIEERKGRPRPVGGWFITNPVAARIALADVYWISRLLRAEVSANASVTYKRANWLHLLRFQAGLRNDSSLETSLWKAEEVLRSAFDFACDLVQNAVEITDEKERLAFEPELRTSPPPEVARWRRVFDEELEEIARQRERRKFREPEDDKGDPSGAVDTRASDDDGWSERIRTGKQPRNLIGLAFSGGGIRSATFNLGVLQGLQDFDLLRRIDFLSTVSGGGFIGSWLIANVLRTRHWLGRLMSWDDSIAHLRRYSNYLAPRTGMFSPDTWTMWVSWARNAFLVQLTGIAWLFALFLSTIILQTGFQKVAGLSSGIYPEVPASSFIAGCLIFVVLLTLLYNLTGGRVTGRGDTLAIGTWLKHDAFRWPWRGKAFSGRWIRRLAIVPLFIASFLAASLLWADATKTAKKALQSYSSIFLNSWHPWGGFLAILWLALVAVACTMLFRHKWHALWISLLCILLFYVELCGVMLLFDRWALHPDHFRWYAFVFGPPSLLAAIAVSVLLFVGFTGRNSNESVREWWTRFGTWLALYILGYLGVGICAIFGPLWLLILLHSSRHWVIKWSAILGWIGSILGGLLAGKSSKTTGTVAISKSPVLEIVAKVGGFLFIVGALLTNATVLYVMLVKIGTGRNIYDDHWGALDDFHLSMLLEALGVVLFLASLFSWFFEINIFGLNQFYRNRLVRCYLGATRWAPGFRQPQPFTKFDGEDDLRLNLFATKFRGPFPIFNCALNLSGSSDLTLHTRHSASFSLTPLRCGSDRRRVGYAPTKSASGEFARGVMLGQAVAISGAAASPNMGYNTSPLVAFLLTMFNIRLGWWFPNPGRPAWDRAGLRFSLYYLLRELFGSADEDNFFVNVSDGGHFENLGVYELVRRRCKVIIACDAECDPELQFGSLGNLVRLCETDFGAKIDIDVSSVRQQKDGFSLAHSAIGRITYSNGSIGYLIYLKASVTGDEDVSITQYRSAHPSFPHQTTADQFFSEDQFESYRKLGFEIVHHSFRSNEPGDHPVAIAEKLADVLAPAGHSSESFVQHTRDLQELWERFRQSSALQPFMDELMLGNVTKPNAAHRNEELAFGLELIQIMENVFLDLRLDDFWEHPDNRGWAILFMRWARSPRLRNIWSEVHRTFGIRFEYFCAARLGLLRDDPIVRV